MKKEEGRELELENKLRDANRLLKEKELEVEELKASQSDMEHTRAKLDEIEAKSRAADEQYKSRITALEAQLKSSEAVPRDPVDVDSLREEVALAQREAEREKMQRYLCAVYQPSSPMKV